jgi:transcription termination factor Rho
MISRSDEGQSTSRPSRRSRRGRGRNANSSGGGEQSGQNSGGQNNAGQNGNRPPSRRRGRRGKGPNPSNQSNPQNTAAQTPEQNSSVPARQVTGLLEITRNGAGMLRELAMARDDDAIIPVNQVSQLGLRPGDLVVAQARGRNVVEIESVNGHEAVDLAKRIDFDRLTAVHPEVPIILGTSPEAITGRLLDVIAPIGRGQRGLIVAPPKAGKTTILTDIAHGVSKNPGLILVACLVGERPEEVTEIRRAVNGMVLAADLDAPSSDHTRVAELAVEYAKRLCEEGKDVVVLLDSLTRLARAYNLSVRGGGSRTLSGGMDAMALQPVRKIFGAARATEEAGSLTIIATCLVDTGSKLDDVVYEEFKGTGNMEVHLDRKLAQRRLFPAIDIGRSSTRREELLLDANMLRQVTALRRKLAGVPSDKALSALLTALRRQIEVEATELA